jgi:hypothetical protein
VTSPDSEPAPPASGPPTNSVGPWPEGFRGIGGHLIRPPAKPETPPPESPAASLPFSLDWLDAHGSHLLAPIVARADGSRAATCPVCLALAVLPETGGWLDVCCAACGTEFVATDGSPPPVVLPPPPPPPLPRAIPVRPSPLKPPPVAWGPLPVEPQGFTDDVRIDRSGHRFVTCPQCHGATVDIPDDAWIALLLRCPACRGPFLVNLSREPTPAGPPDPPAPPPVYDPFGKVWSHCPNCGLAALTPERTDSDRSLVCTVCRQRIVLSKGRSAPRHTPPASQPSVWERIRRWLRGE